jgi:lipoyl(octanoyl) transferase
MHQAWLLNLGQIPYEEAWDLQRRIVAARKAAAVPDVLLFVEHPHVITLGRNARREHLLASDSLLREMNVEVCETDRGGDITYHGPGQVVAYPILNLAELRRDLVWYVRQLEESMIRGSAEYGINAERRAGRTGIWVEVPNAGEEKLAAEEKLGAIGVHVSRWVTSHGLAYNVSTDLKYFDLIVPCGIPDKRATSLEKLCGRQIGSAEVAQRIALHLGDCFEREFRTISRDQLDSALEAAAGASATHAAALAPSI